MAAQRTARCKYCDALGVTKAHVLAESFTSLFDSDGDHGEYMIRHDYVDPGSDQQRLLKRAKTFAHKTRKMCAGCNGGWLRQTEEAVRPTLDCFAHDTPLTLLRTDQLTLALWTMTATLGFLSLGRQPESGFAAPELYREVHRTRQPPVGTQMWLGANPHGEMAWFGSHSLHLPDRPHQAGAFGATLAFGYGVIHVMFHGGE